MGLAGCVPGLYCFHTTLHHLKDNHTCNIRAVFDGFTENLKSMVIVGLVGLLIEYGFFTFGFIVVNGPSCGYYLVLLVVLVFVVK